MSQFEQIAVVNNLTKLQLSLSQSLLTQEIWLRVGLIQCTIALDAGLVACGEKLNRSLCSLKIKLFLDAGGGDWGLFDAQCTFCRLVRGIIKRRGGRGEGEEERGERGE